MLVVGLSVDQFGSTTGEIPQRETGKVRLVLQLADEFLERVRLKVSTAGSVLAGGQSNVDLGRLAGLATVNDAHPLVIVHPVPRHVRVLNSIAVAVVVELDEKGIKLGLVDHLLHVEVRVGSRALGSTSDDDVALESTELIDHGDVRTVC
jgi:hypothetical protein